MFQIIKLIKKCFRIVAIILEKGMLFDSFTHNI